MYSSDFPTARVNDLVITDAAGDVLVYDKLNHTIHHLNHTVGVVWRLCNGRRSVSELASIAGAEVDEEAIQLVLTKLSNLELLTAPVSISTQSRRSVLRRLGVVGAGAAIAEIVSISAPSAAAAASDVAGGDVTGGMEMPLVTGAGDDSSGGMDPSGSETDPVTGGGGLDDVPIENNDAVPTNGDPNAIVDAPEPNGESLNTSNGGSETVDSSGQDDPIDLEAENPGGGKVESQDAGQSEPDPIDGN